MLEDRRADYAEYRLQQQRDDQQRNSDRLAEYQRTQRVEELRKLQLSLLEERQYLALGKQQGYWDYKYAYYVGTLVDQYI